MARTAVVLLNLGGPDAPEAVRPFLFNLFNDPAIIALPQPLRWMAARLISGRRAPLARSIYAKMGGGSPLLANTLAQAEALEGMLGSGHKCFVAMRYWRPFSDETARDVAAWRPDRVVLLPLYPQHSTTTTASSLADWERASRAAGLACPTTALCCYPSDPGFISAVAALVRDALHDSPTGIGTRLLFSAHGLPKKVISAGDPYQWQVEETAAALRAAIARPDLESVVCYQSRVGPLEWIGPATDAEIARAGRDGVALVVVPIAFVSEHSETLVELDIEYRHIAEKNGVPQYRRVPTVGTHPDFIAGLARLVAAGAAGTDIVAPHPQGRLCPMQCRRCPQEAERRAA